MEETVDMGATENELSIVHYCSISCFTSSQAVGDAAAYVVIVNELHRNTFCLKK
jgi:hypothetical protein